MTVGGLLLAGGQSRRMGGGDKALRLLGDVTLLERSIERWRRLDDRLELSANGEPARVARCDLRGVTDSIPGFAGPLAGVLAGLDWAAERPDCCYVVSVATDAPFLPADLVARLAEGRQKAGADLACAASGGRAHPVFGFWPVWLREDLRRALVDEEIRKVDMFTARYRLAVVSFPDAPVDPFFNANRPEDFEAAATLLLSSARSSSDERALS